MGLRVASRSAEAVSGRRETLDSPGHAVRSLSLRGASPPRKWRAEPGTHEVWVLAVRLGGRNRLDASRVFLTGSSQGLVVSKGASQEEVRSAA
jgi:hypothetical protein